MRTATDQEFAQVREILILQKASSIVKKLRRGRRKSSEAQGAGRSQRLTQDPLRHVRARLPLPKVFEQFERRIAVRLIQASVLDRLRVLGQGRPETYSSPTTCRGWPADCKTPGPALRETNGQELISSGLVVNLCWNKCADRRSVHPGRDLLDRRELDGRVDSRQATSAGLQFGVRIDALKRERRCQDLSLREEWEQTNLATVV